MSLVDTVKEYGKICKECYLGIINKKSPKFEINEMIQYVEDFYKKNFCDLKIVSSDAIFPCHKYILSLQSEVIRKGLLEGIKTLNWNDLKSNIVLELLRWCYTQKVKFVSVEVALALLQASFRFQFNSLFKACEDMLVLHVNENSCVKIHSIAKMVVANNLAEACLKLKKNHNDDLPTEALGDRIEIESPNLSDSEKIGGSSAKTELAAEKSEVWQVMYGIFSYLTLSDTIAFLNVDEVFRAHSHVFKRRSETVEKEFFNHWHFETRSLFRKVLLRWIYTDRIIWHNEEVILELLLASHRHKISTLFEVSEKLAVESVNIRSCREFLNVAKAADATKLIQHCTNLLSSYWDGLQFHNVNDINELLKIILDKPLDCIQNSNMKYETSDSSILQLNDECLLKIFKNVSLTDLSSIKSTCRRFSGLADQCYENYGHNSMVISSCNLFESIWNLEHFGKFINCLTIGDIERNFWLHDNIFAIVAKHCNTNLKRFCLNHYYQWGIKDVSLARLKVILKNVESIKLQYFGNNGQMDLLLSYCENLREVHLLGNGMQLNTSWIENNCNIKKVTMTSMKNDDALEEIGKKLLHLEYLDFGCRQSSNSSDIDYIGNRNLNHLAQLDNLKELTIFYPFDTLGPLLRKLAKKDSLEYLALWKIDQEIANTLIDFTKLKKLVFSLNGILPIDIPSILSRSLANLEIISFIHCTQITFYEITDIIQNLLGLKELIIANCPEIKSIDKYNYLRLRKYRNLTIFVDTSVFLKSLPLLSHEFSDYVILKNGFM